MPGNSACYKALTRDSIQTVEPIPVLEQILANGTNSRKKIRIRNCHDQRSKKSQNPTPEPIPVADFSVSSISNNQKMLKFIFSPEASNVFRSGFLLFS